jgi:hypothetical protein
MARHGTRISNPRVSHARSFFQRNDGTDSRDSIFPIYSRRLIPFVHSILWAIHFQHAQKFRTRFGHVPKSQNKLNDLCEHTILVVKCSFRVME